MTETSLRQYHLELDVLMGQEALEEVIGHCRHILKYYPKNVATYRTLGRALLSKARFEQAGDVFRRVLSVEPGDRLAHQGMSAVYRDRKNFASAIWHMERAFEQDPNNTAIQKTLRELYARQEDGDYGKLQLTRGALARMYVQSGLLEKAISELQNALKDHPDRIDLRVLLARAMWESNYPVEAGEVATEVVQVLPYCLEANRILAALWLKNNRPTDAQPFLARVEELDPYAALALVSEDSEEDPFTLERLDWNVAEASMLSAATPDWMREIGDVLEKPEDVKLAGEDSVPDWMLDMALSGPPPAAPAPAETLPDWMEEASAETAPGPLDDLDWMADFQEPADQPVDASYLDRQVESASPDTSGFDDDDDLLNLLADMDEDRASSEDAPVSLDWVQGAGSESAPPGDMDWLSALESPVEQEPLPPDASAESPATPDWFAEVQAAALDSASEDELDWLGGESTPPPVAADWMADAEPPEIPQPRKPVEPGERVPTGFTGLLGGLQEQDDKEDEDPLAWLTTPSAESEAEAVEAEEAEEEEVGSTSWLRNAVAESELDDEEEAPADDLAWLELGGEDELPEALAESGPLASPASGLDEDDPLAWLYSEEAVLEETAFEVSLDEPDAGSGDDPLSWLHAAAPEAETEEEPAMTSPPEADRPESWEPQPDSDADDWLSALGGSQDEPAPGDEPLDDDVPEWLAKAAPVPPAAASGDEAAEDDWLAAISQGAETGVGDSDEEAVPDWLSQMGASAGDQPAEPAPDWLSRMGDLNTEEPEISQPDFLFGAEEDSPAAEESPSWLSAIGHSEEPEEEVPAAEAAGEPEIEEGMRLEIADTPDWLDSLGVEEEAPAEPARPEATGVTDWLNAVQPDDEGGVSGLMPEDAAAWKGLLGEEDADEETEVPQEEEPPDWLGAPPAAAEAAPDWLSELGAMSEETLAAETADAPDLPAAEGLPDWLSSMQPIDEAGEEEEPVGEEIPAEEAPAEAEAEPDWLGMMPAAEVEEEAPEMAMPEPPAADWLSELGSLDEEAPVAEAEEAPAAEGLPDWLGMMPAIEAEEAPEMATPEPAAAAWLSELGSLEEEAPAAEAEEEAPAAEGLPDWLGMMPAIEAEEAPEMAMPEPPAADWLSELGSLDEEAPVAEAEEEAPAAEGLPDWLGMKAEEAPEMAMPEPAVADWLSELGSLDEEVPAAEAKEEAPAVEGLPDWLSSMQPSDEAGEEEEPVGEEIPAEEAPAEAEAEPDWLGMMPAAEVEEAPKMETLEPAAADWLSELGSLDEEAPVAEAEEEAPVAEEAPAEAEAEPDWLSMEPAAELETPAEVEAEEAPVEAVSAAEVEIVEEEQAVPLGEADLARLVIAEVAASEEALAEEPAEAAGDWLDQTQPVGVDHDAELAAALVSEEEPTAEAAAGPEAEAEFAADLLGQTQPVGADADFEAALDIEEALPEQLEAEAGALPDWLSEAGVSGAELVLDEVEAEAEIEEPEEVAAELEGLPTEPGALPDWLSEVPAAGEEAPEEEPLAEAPISLEDTGADWLGELGELDLEEEAAEAPAAPVAEADALPDWLNAMAGPADDFAEEALPEQPAAEIEAAAEDEIEAAVPAAEAGELPDWLSQMAAPAEAFEEPAEAEVEAEFEMEAEIEAEPGALPDWLSQQVPLGEEETLGAAADEVELEEEGLPAWLDEMEPLVLDEEAAEPAAVGLEKPALDAELLEDVSPEEAAPEEPAVTAGEKVSIHDTLEWLSDIGSLEAEPEEGLAGESLPVADAETGPQWLRDVGMLQPEEQAAPEDVTGEPEPEPAPEPEARPAARFSFGDFEPRWARPEPGSAAKQPPASLPEEASDLSPETPPEASAEEADDLSESPPWLDEDSGPAWLRRVIEEEDDSEG